MVSHQHRIERAHTHRQTYNYKLMVSHTIIIVFAYNYNAERTSWPRPSLPTNNNSSQYTLFDCVPLCCCIPKSNQKFYATTALHEKNFSRFVDRMRWFSNVKIKSQGKRTRRKKRIEKNKTWETKRMGKKQENNFRGLVLSYSRQSAIKVIHQLAYHSMA